MDLSTVKHIMKEENIRRRKEGLYLYCGEKGHFANGCPKKKKNFKGKPPQKQSASSAASTATKIPTPTGKSKTGEILYSISEDSPKNQ
jgi:hypothetical protein